MLQTSQIARESPAWINTRLEFEIAAIVRKDRINRRLKYLLSELEEDDLNRPRELALLHQEQANRPWVSPAPIAITQPPQARMSVIDRIKAKATQARAIAPKAIADFEADLDSLIAEGPVLENARLAAVGMHKQAFSGIQGEIDGLKSAIDILSNGAPPLGNSETK